jgi:hypothetical protein
MNVIDLTDQDVLNDQLLSIEVDKVKLTCWSSADEDLADYYSWL